MDRDFQTDLHTVATMYINGYWDMYGYGVPAIDIKRPFGNSFWYRDVAEELEIEAFDDEGFSDEQMGYIQNLMKQVPEYLQKVWAERFGTNKT